MSKITKFSKTAKFSKNAIIFKKKQIFKRAFFLNTMISENAIFSKNAIFYKSVKFSKAPNSLYRIPLKISTDITKIFPCFGAENIRGRRLLEGGHYYIYLNIFLQVLIFFCLSLCFGVLTLMLIIFKQ